MQEGREEDKNLLSVVLLNRALTSRYIAKLGLLIYIHLFYLEQVEYIVIFHLKAIPILFVFSVKYLFFLVIQ